MKMEPKKERPFNDALLYVLQAQVKNLTGLCRAQLEQNEELLRQNRAILKQMEEMNQCLQETGTERPGVIKNALKSGELVEMRRLMLPNRLQICLKYAGIAYVNDLVRYTRGGLLRLPKLGEKGVADIERELQRHGLMLAAGKRT